ncbi:hypothetical protein [Trabulsiella odontotermitis]|uniref:Uncharacterized protein n=1 Tax=Trabulsiella odontotermitis TaxID=379893 RepID=A0A0L0GY58_9ENTR|nr:hypothetical protein [Trabulsiella odontotermitis]KNC93631.1 hypothetical protein GM31_18795 [Trabulsiella odontotermitis]
MSIELKVNRCYRAKKPRSVSSFPPLVNDRQIIHIGATHVQYDGPAVKYGRHFPSMTKEAFIAWAERDVTDELPAGEWQTWPVKKGGAA